MSEDNVQKLVTLIDVSLLQLRQPSTNWLSERMRSIGKQLEKKNNKYFSSLYISDVFAALV